MPVVPGSGHAERIEFMCRCCKPCTRCAIIDADVFFLQLLEARNLILAKHVNRVYCIARLGRREVQGMYHICKAVTSAGLPWKEVGLDCMYSVRACLQLLLVLCRVLHFLGMEWMCWSCHCGHCDLKLAPPSKNVLVMSKSVSFGWQLEYHYVKLSSFVSKMKQVCASSLVKLMSSYTTRTLTLCQ